MGAGGHTSSGDAVCSRAALSLDGEAARWRGRALTRKGWGGAATCVVSMVPIAPPCARSRRSKSVVPKPRATAADDLTTGGSCWWSPASTARLPRRRATQHDASSACAASSITTRSNGRSGGSVLSARSCAPVFVHSTT